MSGFALDFESIIRFNAAQDAQDARLVAQENSVGDALEPSGRDSPIEPNLWMRYHYMMEYSGNGMQSESSDETKSPRGPLRSLGCSSSASNLSAHSNTPVSDPILLQDFDRLLSIARAKPELAETLSALGHFVDPDRIYIDIDEKTNECIELGSSFQSQVFRAEVNNQAVAVKMSRSLSILQEYALICKLHPHPSIIRPVAYSLLDNVYMACYELAGHGDLASFLKAHPQRRTDQRFLKRIATSVLSALEHIHSAGYLHSDIKPENILLMADETVKVADFGMCQLIKSEKMLAQGTPSYLAPEVVAQWVNNNNSSGSVSPLSSPRASRAFKPAADIFSFGVTMCNIVLDRFPYKRITIKLKKGHIFSPEELCEIFALPTRLIRDLEILHPNLAAVVRLCLRQRPELRPTAQELRVHFSTEFCSSSTVVSIV